MEITTVALDDLHQDPSNARAHGEGRPPIFIKVCARDCDEVLASSDPGIPDWLREDE